MQRLYCAITTFQTQKAPRLTKFLALTGLTAASMTMLFQFTNSVFFAYAAALVLIIAALCLGTMAAEDTAKCARKVMERKWPHLADRSNRSPHLQKNSYLSCERHQKRYTRNHARCHRTASRSVVSSGSKTGSDDGESDQGDCSGPDDLPSSSPSVTLPAQTEKPNRRRRSLLPWLRPGICRIPCRKSAVRGCLA